MLQLLSHVSTTRRIQGVTLLVLMALSSAAELFAITAIVPFLHQIISTKSRIAAPGGFAEMSETSLRFAAIFCGAAMLAALARLSLLWLLNRFVYGLGHETGKAIYRQALYQPYAIHVARDTNEVIAGITKTQMLVASALLPMMTAFSAAVVVTSIFGAVLWLDTRLALICTFVFALSYSAIYLLTGRGLRREGSVISRAQTERLRAMREGLASFRDITINHAQPFFLERYDRIDRVMRRAQASVAFMAAAPRLVIETLGLMLMAVVVLALGGAPGGLNASIPVLGAVALAAQRTLPLIQQIYAGLSQYWSGRQMLLDIAKLLQSAQEMPVEALPAEPAMFEHAIELRGVSFAYSSDAPKVLDRISLTIGKGSAVGLIGRSGSGKSTLVDLVMGLLAPSEGSILVDGHTLDPGRRKSWQLQIGHVPQHIHLSDASIAANIAFGINETAIDRARLAMAIERAGLKEYVDAQPMGVATRVGEEGNRLSGGQRQRIGLARALYKAPRILVLDEASSALDEDTESSIFASIARLAPEVTTIIITHRMSALRYCDRVCLLEGGKLLEKSGPS